jgi:hypothetical protein
MRHLIFLLALLYQTPCFAADAGDGALKTGILIAIIGGLMGLVPLVVQVISNRSQRKSHGHRLANLAAELEFLEKWTHLRKEHQADGVMTQSDSSGAGVVSDLERILTQFQSLKLRKEEHEKKPIHDVSFLRRAFLLFLPVSAKGWLYHTAYYVLAFMTWWMIWVSIFDVLFSWPNLDSDLILGTTIFVLILSVPTTIFWRKANRDRKLHIEMRNMSSDS